jgi:hypothetical protein
MSAAPARDAAVAAWLDAEREKYQSADAAALPLAQAAAHTTTALDALLAVSPLALEGAEREALAAARHHAGVLHRALEARRAARVVEGRGPVGPARWEP